jgi:hypothetical protein
MISQLSPAASSMPSDPQGRAGMFKKSTPGQSGPADGSRQPSRHYLRRRFVLVLVLAFSALAMPAAAYGAETATQGFVLIQQALGHLAHDTGHSGVAAATASVDDALAAADQQGVDLSQVRQAKTALQTDHVSSARALLQQSITGAVSRLGPATGEQTGTTLVLTPLRGRGGLTGQDWGFGTTALLLALAGIVLALRFRPADNLTQLRRRLAASAPVAVSTAAAASPTSTSVPVTVDHDTTEGTRP